MPTHSAKFGLPIPTLAETPDMPEAMHKYTDVLEVHLEKTASTLSTAASQAADYEANGYRKRGFIPAGQDVQELDYGLWTLSSAWGANRNLTNMPGDKRADAPGTLEVIPFASGLRMLRWTTAALSSSAKPYTWVKFQGYKVWGPWAEISPDIPLTSIAGLTGAVSADNLADALKSPLTPWITEAVSQASIDAAEGDLEAFDVRYVRGDDVRNMVGGPGTLGKAAYPAARNNTAYGVRALPNLTKGRYNDFFGLEAGFSLDGAAFSESEGKASRNAGFGANTQRFNKSGSLNVSMGRNTLQSNETGTHNTVVGADSAGGIAHMRLSDGQIENQIPQNFWGNSTLGTAALSRTQGNQHVAVGAYTLHHHKVGTGNVGVGFGALRNAGKTGGYNGKALVDVSGQASWKNLDYSLANELCVFTAPEDHGLAPGFMLEVSIPTYETQFWYVTEVVGRRVSLAVGMPDFTKSGSLSVLNYTTNATAPETTHAVAIGFQAGQAIEGQGECTAIRNAVAIGANAPFIADDTVTLGNSSQTVHVYAPVQVRSDARDKKDVAPLKAGLALVRELRPVSYRLDPRYGVPADDRLHAGFIAQEAAQVADGTDFEGVTTTGGTFSIAYEELIPVLVNAMQELVGEIDSLKRGV